MYGTDPVTGAPIPADAIQRVLYLTPSIHIYNIPPISSSTAGFKAASWTENNNQRLIFTGRLRIIETAIPRKGSSSAGKASGDDGEDLSTTIHIEDKSTGELFAAAPYTNPAAVQQASDSSRFFAVRVVGGGGKQKATLGIGFEERSEAFDFGVALQDARRVLGFEGEVLKTPGSTPGDKKGKLQGGSAEKLDFSLKEGQQIHVEIGGKGGGKMASKPVPALAQPSGGGAMPFLPPPPSASQVKAERRRSREPVADANSFGDDDFGEFTG